MKKIFISAVISLLLIGCGGDSSSQKIVLPEGETELDSETVSELYIQDVNSTTIGYIPDGYEASFGADGSIVYTKVEEQPTVGANGNENIIVNCNGGSCPIEIVIDSNNDFSNNDVNNTDNTHDPLVVDQNSTVQPVDPVIVEQPTPIIVDQPTPIVVEQPEPIVVETTNTTTTTETIIQGESNETVSP